MIGQTLHNRYHITARLGKVGVNEWETNKRILAANAIRLREAVVKFVDGKTPTYTLLCAEEIP